MIDEFLDYLRYERRRSPETITSYEVSLREFREYYLSIDSQLTWTTVDEDVIRDWMAHMMDNGMEASSVGTRFAALRSFYRHALSRGNVHRNPTYRVEAPKKAKPLPHFLKESEMNRLLDDIEWGDSYNDMLERAVVVTFYETGIRRAELIGLDDRDVDFAAKQIKVTGKGDKQRLVPFGKELEETLRRYMEMRDREVQRSDDATFVTDKGKRVSEYKVGNIVRRRLSMVSTQKKLSPHVLRHTYATAMLNNGASIESVRRLLGHASASTTEVYTHTTFEQLKRVYKNAHPRA